METPTTPLPVPAWIGRWGRRAVVAAVAIGSYQLVVNLYEARRREVANEATMKRYRCAQRETRLRNLEDIESILSKHDVEKLKEIREKRGNGGGELRVRNY